MASTDIDTRHESLWIEASASLQSEQMNIASRRLHSLTKVDNQAFYIIFMSSEYYDYIVSIIINVNNTVIQAIKMYSDGPIFDVVMVDKYQPATLDLVYDIKMPDAIQFLYHGQASVVIRSRWPVTCQIYLSNCGRTQS